MFRHVQRRIWTPAPTATRSYATRHPRTPIPHEALVARTASTPLAVRERREKKFGPVPDGETDATPHGLTPSDWARYNRHKALGTLPKITITRRAPAADGGDGKENLITVTEPVSPLEWLKRRNARRSRVRGFKTVRRPVSGIPHKPSLATSVKTHQELLPVGQPVYLPNVIFRLVRNHTPEGQAYNPYEATFRVPPSITKTDIRSYLSAVYGVKTTYIRTDLYYGRLVKRGASHRKERRAYKRAVVGLIDPFYYPHRMEDMPESSEERKEREKFIQDNYHLDDVKKSTQESKLRSAVVAARGGEQDKKWKYSGAVRGRGKILAEVAKRRQLKEGVVAGLVSEWQKTRQTGKTVTVPPPRSRKPVEKKIDAEAK
ncbi:hypothetical protein GYMLUDRAFT_97206 [Collybiopsis luxurians FD-317 M1]|uniref:Large ribosomal subunit protein uL23m n=1 Tax=Collybiopsis luxurians FD-317 M1 TaxID=944289 RepID=A0A0D0CWK4_9AGAR|nr:hypothetical protein GYMLUDRAFT_97206 [Collybiopsis luxurians FD-317 M1]